MPSRRPLHLALFAPLVCLLLAFTAQLAQAAQMVSVKQQANMRSGAGLNHGVQWQLDQGYPLLVLGSRGPWLKVRDFENDVGWVHRSVTGNQHHVIVKVDRANVRRGPSLRQRILTRVGYGDVLRTLETRQDWVKVRVQGGPVGWVARRLLWGW
jgi:SH3-like domain-containing protein